MAQDPCPKTLFDALQTLIRGLKIAEANGAEAAASRLSTSDLQALMLIGEREHCIVSDVANGLNISPTTTSSLVERLARNGYVERRRCVDDRRSVRLALSPEGARIREEAIALQLDHCQLILDELSPAEAATFVALMQKIGDGLNREDMADTALSA